MDLSLTQFLVIVFSIVGLSTLPLLYETYRECWWDYEAAIKRNASEGWRIKTRTDLRTARGHLGIQIGFLVVGVAVFIGSIWFPGVGVGGIVLTIVILAVQGWFRWSSGRDKADADKLNVYLKGWDGLEERRKEGQVKTPIVSPAIESHSVGSAGPTGTNTPTEG